MRWGQRRVEAGALLFFSLLGLWWSYPLVFHAGTHIATPLERAPLEHKRPLSRAAYNDQLLSISGLARNAARLARGDLAGVYDHRVCHPTPGAAFLGEHMLEPALLGLPAYTLTRNPLLAYNTSVALSTLIGAMSMFALVRYWTGSVWAALVGGLLFAFHPGRLDNLTHPAVVGIHWMPLVLLRFEKLLDRPAVSAAAALCLVATLQALVGSYPLLVLACFGIPYGAVRLVQRRDAVAATAPYLTASVLICLAIVGMVLAPYAAQQRLWDVLRLRWTILAEYGDFLPGRRFAAGIAVLALAPAVMLKTARDWSSQSLAVICGLISCLALCAAGPFWPGGPELPSLYVWLSGAFEFLAYIRAPVSLRLGVYFGLAILAGLGAAALLRTVPRGGHPIVVAALSAAIIIEIFNPWVSAAIYKRTRRLVVERATPNADVMEAFALLDERGIDGPVLDLPYSAHPSAQLQEMPLYLHAATFFPERATAACYNSYNAPSHFDVARMTGQLPAETAVTALAAAGFRNLLVHRQASGDGRAVLEGLGARNDIEVLSDAGAVALFRITRDVATQADLEALSFAGLRLPTSLRVGLFLTAVHVDIRNDGKDAWAMERPIRPLKAFVRFVDDSDDVEAGYLLPARLLPPLGLAAGDTASVPLTLSRLPPPGRYRIDLKIPELGWDLSSETPVLVLPSERVTYGAPW